MVKMDVSELLALIISLPEAIERRERLSAALDDRGLAHEVIDAVDGRHTDMTAHSAYDRTRRMRYFGRDMLGAEIGCFLSHRNALAHIVQNDLPYALVFEDDAIPHEALVTVTEYLTANADKFEFVRFIAKNKVYNAPQKTVGQVGDIRIARMMGTPGGAYAYFVTQAGAQKLLAQMQSFYQPVDTVMGYAWRSGVDNLCTIPSPVSHGALEDTFIGDDRFDKRVTASGVMRALYPATRFFYKTRENIMKRVCFSISNRKES